MNELSLTTTSTQTIETKAAEAELNLKNYLSRVLWRRERSRQEVTHKKPLDMAKWIALHGDAFEKFYLAHPSFFGERTKFSKRESYPKKIMIIEATIYKDKRWR